ncbi:MAG: type II toxin-antitoxin system RelE/ParE family toxin [Sphingobacteriales bacterium]
MAEKIEWSERARKELLEILEYWTNRNKSKTYSIKLNELVLDGVELTAEIPESGIPTKFPNVRIKIVRDYLIYYRIHTASIEVLTIWDSRRNPKKFKL